MEDNRRGEKDWALLGRRILDTARQELFLGMRYLFSALNMLEYSENRQIAYVATDGSSLYYNPMLLAQRYKAEPTDVNRAFLHMVMHCLFRNIFEGSRYESDEDRQLWDLACDICAEYLIDSIELSCVMKPENTERENIYRELSKSCRVFSAQNVYYVLKTQMRSSANKWSAAGIFYVDDHRYWYENRKENNGESGDNSGDDDANGGGQPDGGNKKSEKQWEDAAKKLQSAMSFDSGRGDTKGRLLRTLRAENHKEISYRDFLRKFAVVREKMHVDMDSFDYGYYNYGMTVYKNMPLIEELEYREESGIEDFVIVLDTSGSCAYSLIQRFIDTTFNILTESEVFFDKIKLHIVQCDNQIQEDTVITDISQAEAFKNNFTVRGFGGTDFRPAFNYIEKLRREGSLKRLKGVLYFTDGYGIYPSHRPAYDVAFVFPEMYDAERIVPGWAIRVELPELQE